MKNLAAPLAAVVLLIAAAPADPGTAVQAFYNAYAKVCGSIESYNDRVKWVKSQPMVSPELKEKFVKIHRVEEYGADAVMAAQDYPDEPMRVKSVAVRGDTATVVVVSPDPNFRHSITIGLVRRDGKWLIDAIGPVKGS